MKTINQIRSLIILYFHIDTNLFLNKYNFIEKYYKNITKHKLLLFILKNNLILLLSMITLILTKQEIILTYIIIGFQIIHIVNIDLSSLSLLDNFEMKQIKLNINSFVLSKVIFNTFIKSSTIIQILILIYINKTWAIWILLITTSINIISYYYYYFVKINKFSYVYITLNYIAAIIGCIASSFSLTWFFKNIVVNIFYKTINKINLSIFSLSKLQNDITSIQFISILTTLLIVSILLLSLNIKNETTISTKKINKIKSKNYFMKIMLNNWGYFQFIFLYLFFDRGIFTLISLFIALHIMNVTITDYQIIFITTWILIIDLNSLITHKANCYLNLFQEHKFISLISKNKILSILNEKIRNVIKFRKISILIMLLLPYFILQNKATYIPFLILFMILLIIVPKLLLVSNLVTYKQDYADINTFLIEQPDYIDKKFIIFEINEKILMIMFAFGFIIPHNWQWINLIVILIEIVVLLLQKILAQKILKQIIKNIQKGNYTSSYEKIF